jgi:hypothetical protein
MFSARPSQSKKNSSWRRFAACPALRLVCPMADERSSSLPNRTPLLRRLGASISGNDGGVIGKEALLQAFDQVDNSGKRKVGQACHP